MSVKVAASILSADFLNLGNELKRAEEAGCDYIHVDIMDGNYVDNMAVGLCVAQWLHKGTKLRLDAHLAVDDPMKFIKDFADAGMDSILFHPDSCPHHIRLIQMIRDCNMLAGIVLSPTASIDSVRHLLSEVDIIDQLAVDAGFPNQEYCSFVSGKLTELKELKAANGYRYEIQVDGGINVKTCRNCGSSRSRGADFRKYCI